MELLANPSIKAKYQKCKLRVKRWESGFMDQYGRKPNKNDIKRADSTIKESYKMYWQLKTQALEETLLDITFTDESQGNVWTNSFTDNLTNCDSLDSSLRLSDDIAGKLDTEASKNDSFESSRNVENIDPEKSPMKPEQSPITRTTTLDDSNKQIDSVNNETAWGQHLNKNNEGTKKSSKRSIGRSSSFQLSQCKFSSNGFSKRNPRKSLSMMKVKCNADEDKLGTAPSGPNNEASITPDHESTANVLTKNENIIQSQKQSLSQPINAIRQLMSVPGTVTERNLNIGWLDRCAKDIGLTSQLMSAQRLSGISDSGVESMDMNIASPTRNAVSVSTDKSGQISDDEEFVCISDSEQENRKRVRNWRKTLSDGTLSQLKRRCSEDSPDTPASTTISCQKPICGQKAVNTINKNVVEPVTNYENTVRDTGAQIIPPKTQIGEIRRNNCLEKIPDSTQSKECSPVLTSLKQKVSAQVETGEFEEDDMSKPKTARNKRMQLRKRTTQRPSQNTRRASKNITKSRRNPQSEDEDSESENSEVHTEPSVSSPIYDVEALGVAPRFAVPRDTRGDLVSEFSQTLDAAPISKDLTKKPKALMTEKEKFLKKITSEKANENFVRINLKKKVFVRGKRSFNFSKYKKNQWKRKKAELSSSEAALDLADLAEKNICFKCGEAGHMGRRCPAMKSDALLPQEEADECASMFPTLEEVEKMTDTATHLHSRTIKEKSMDPHVPCDNPEDEWVLDEHDLESVVQETEQMIGHKIPDDLVAKLLPPVKDSIAPVYPPSAYERLKGVPEEVSKALKMFGHSAFRPGQEQAIMRTLSGQSTLVTMATGSGKSLCYQLPAYLYSKRSRCITLVISPLVSLMDDQVSGIPSFLSAAAYHTGHSQKVREKILQMIKDSSLDILLVSPEAVVAGEKITAFGSLLRQLPPIAFACIDEAHCISQWSHNFRPSYLMICRVLLEKLGVKTILGLTATATRQNAENIAEHLKIPDGMAGVISDIPIPNNLTLTVSKDERRDHALVDLIRSDRFKEYNSIVIYCTRREECSRIAGSLRISLRNPQDEGKPQSKSKVSSIAEAYHAGLSATQRKNIQKSFMRGDTRIVVATVAFGMGINKFDIRSVIHYNMPKNFEGYVQEVGRSGRDSLPAHCHLFLNPGDDCDKWELRRHIYADSVDRHTIRKLLRKIFVPCSCSHSKSQSRCSGHEVAIPIDDTVGALDISEEIISTLLCYLELHPKKLITVLSSVYIQAKVTSYKGPTALKIAAQSSPPLAMAVALDTKRGISHEKSSMIKFPVVDVAAAIGWDSGVVKSHLKNLEWTNVDGKSARSSISVNFDTLGFRVKAPGDLTDAELDEALDALFERTQAQEKCQLSQLDNIYAALSGSSFRTVRECVELNEESVLKSENLKTIIRDYFQSSESLNIGGKSECKPVANEQLIVSDVRSLIASYRDNNFTGRAVARIFHGIQSPNYSALTWSKCRFWRMHLRTDFNAIVEIATREILASR